MKKKLVCLLIVLMLVFSFGACGGGATDGDEADGADSSEQSMLIKDGVLMVGFNATYPPLEYVDPETGEFVGFDVDLAKALAAELGLEVEFVDVAWDGIFMGLDADKYDIVISGVSMTKERVEGDEMIFTAPYLNNGQYIVVPKGVTGIDSAEKLAGLKVGVQMATTADEACQKQLEETEFELVQYDDITQTFMDMETGRLDAIVVDYAVAVDYVNKNADKFELTSGKLTNEPMAVAMDPSNVELQTALNGALATLFENGTCSEISKTHFDGFDATQDIDVEIK